MKSVLVMAGRNCLGYFAFHLDAEVVRQHKFFSGNAPAFREGKDCGEHGNRRMHQQAVDAILCGRELRIVEIIGVNRYAVNPGSKARGGFESGANDCGLAAASAKMIEVAAANRAGFGAGAGESKAKAIEDGFFAKFDDLAWDILIFCFEDKRSHVAGQSMDLREIIPRR